MATGGETRHIAKAKSHGVAALWSSKGETMTKEKKKRIEGDRYYTPRWLVKQCMDEVLPVVLPSGYYRRPLILEPCAGTGRFVDGLRLYYPNATIVANDLMPPSHCHQWAGANNSSYEDFLADEQGPWGAYDLIVTNPPFAPALDVIKKSIECASVVVMLVRQGFLSSAGRAAFYKAHPPSDLFFAINRPAYDVPPEVLLDPAYKWVEGQTDQHDYVFVVWRKGSTSTQSHWLMNIPKEDRQS